MIAETEGWTVYDAIADPELALKLVELIRTGERIETGEDAICCAAVRDLPDAFEEVVRVDDIPKMRDTFKERLLDIVKTQAPELA